MKTIEERLASLEAAVAALRPQVAVDLATDQYADFVVRKCPPRWIDSGGRDYTGEHISTTTAEFCDAIAGFLTWQAEKDEAKNYSYVNAAGKTVFPAKFARTDAARARAWAVKLRKAPPAQARAAAASDYASDADELLPF